MLPFFNSRKMISGFTLIEMIIALVILAIVSSVIMSRFLGSNEFNALIVRDQLISIIRTAQQNALGRTAVSLSVSPDASGDELAVVRSDSGGIVESISIDMRSVSISGDINVTSSCGSVNGQYAITNATPLTINFGELGSLANSGVTGGTIGPVNSALRICLNNDPVFSMCVSPSGFAYVGDCDD